VADGQSFIPNPGGSCYLSSRGERNRWGQGRKAAEAAAATRFSTRQSRVRAWSYDAPSDLSNYCVPGLAFYIGKAQRLGLRFLTWSTGADEGMWSLNSKRTQLEMTVTYPLNVSGTATWNGSSYVGTWVSPSTDTFYSNFSVTVGRSCPS
jgi:hypothetical protein